MQTTDELYRCDSKSLWVSSTQLYMNGKIDRSKELILLECKKPLICKDLLFIKKHRDAIDHWQKLLDKEH